MIRDRHCNKERCIHHRSFISSSWSHHVSWSPGPSSLPRNDGDDKNAEMWQNDIYLDLFYPIFFK